MGSRLLFLFHAERKDNGGPTHHTLNEKKKLEYENSLYYGYLGRDLNDLGAR